MLFQRIRFPSFFWPSSSPPCKSPTAFLSTHLRRALGLLPDLGDCKITLFHFTVPSHVLPGLAGGWWVCLPRALSFGACAQAEPAYVLETQVFSLRAVFPPLCKGADGRCPQAHCQSHGPRMVPQLAQRGQGTLDSRETLFAF